MAEQTYMGTGRRKSSTARVYMQSGTGTITINKRPLENFFGHEIARMIVMQPLQVAELNGKFDIKVNVRGGGLSGQAGAIRHGITRALIQAAGIIDPNPTLTIQTQFFNPFFGVIAHLLGPGIGATILALLPLIDTKEHMISVKRHNTLPTTIR